MAGLVWDQAERDVKCPRSLAHYACMQRLLIRSWRRAGMLNTGGLGCLIQGVVELKNTGRGTENTFIYSLFRKDVLYLCFIDFKKKAPPFPLVFSVLGDVSSAPTSCSSGSSWQGTPESTTGGPGTRRSPSTPLNTKGYSSTYLAMGFANVRAGTQKSARRFWVPARTLANPIAR